MRIIVVGGAGTIGKAAMKALSDRHEVVVAGRYLFDDPIPVRVGFSVANGGVEGFVRAAALGLDRGVRINAVSPGLAEDSDEQFGQINPGRIPVPMSTIGAAFVRSVEGWRTGETIRAW
ncbi:MAG TPA: hypothetical protein VH573_14795 [Mycobacteriales bacterium]|jgi:NAD(P)-dependent dehydrogenase (short-subunit alcohol dehydrogenase family)